MRMENEQEAELSLEEMLTLARRVDNWEKHPSDELTGSLERLDFKIGYKLPESGLKMYHYVNVNRRDINIGSCESKEEQVQKRIRELYVSAETKIRENKEREKLEALKYSKSLL